MRIVGATWLLGRSDERTVVVTGVEEAPVQYSRTSDVAEGYVTLAYVTTFWYWPVPELTPGLKPHSIPSSCVPVPHSAMGLAVTEPVVLVLEGLALVVRYAALSTSCWK